MTPQTTNEKEQIMILGYHIEDWEKIYKLYVHENEKEPKNIWDLMQFWDEFFIKSPSCCEKVFLKLSAAQKIDAAKCRILLKEYASFIKGI